MQSTSFRKKLERDPPGSKLDQLTVRSFRAALRATQLKAASGDPAHSKSLPQISAAPRTLVHSAAIPTIQAIPVAVADSPVPQANRSQRRSKEPTVIDLDQPGYQRIDSVLRILGGISKSSLYANLKRRGGPYPDPIRLGTGNSRAVGFRNADLKALLALLDQQAEAE